LKGIYRERLILAVMIILTLAWTAFIWYNSIMNGEESTEMSDGFSDRVEEILENVGVDVEMDSHTTRKSAHFFEFAVHGLLMFITLKTAKTVHVMGWAAAGSFLTAVVDECIQLFSDGRSGNIVDICIDCSGALCGILLMWLIFRKRI
jgi:VanZ family protein